MSSAKLRNQIAFEAARLLYVRDETQYHRARLRAARLLSQRALAPRQLPSNREIREQITSVARLHEGEQRRKQLWQMREAALALMQAMRPYYPRLVGDVLTGYVHPASVIEICVFAAQSEIIAALDDLTLSYEFNGHGLPLSTGVQAHVRVHEHYPAELLVCDGTPDQLSLPGEREQKATIAELEKLLAEDARSHSRPCRAEDDEEYDDRFLVYRSLLAPLEQIQQDPRRHPEGDLLYHSLQVFELAREALPYDEEFLLAALLHDVGKAIDHREHTLAALDALDGTITERTAWLIAHQPDARALAEGTLGVRSRRRLAAHESYDELLLLRDFDFLGRQRGARVMDLDEALDYLRELDRESEA